MKLIKYTLLLLASVLLGSCSQGTISLRDLPASLPKLSTPTVNLKVVPGSTNTKHPATPTETPKPSLTPTIEPTELLTTPTKLKRTITQQPTLTEDAFDSLPLTKIAMVGYVGTEQTILIINMQGEIISQIAVEPFLPVSVSWSPDGHRFAFTDSFNRDSLGDVYIIISSEGSQIKRITYPPNDKYHVSWSPTGEYLVYTEGGETTDLVLVNLDTLETEKITYTEGCEYSPKWSSDGKKIAFVYSPDCTTKGHLWIMDVDGTNRHQVGNRPVGVGLISWSPDGSKIAFESVTSCGNIYKVNIDGSEFARITDIRGCASHPVWSPDGKYLAYLGRVKIEGDEIEQIHIIDTDNGNNFIITPPEWLPQYFSWSPVPILELSKTYNVTEAGANLNLRQEPSLSSTSLKRIQAGEEVLVLDGPVDQDGYYWWQIRTSDGIEGWAVEFFGWFQLFK